MKHSNILFALPVLLLCLNACKKDAVLPQVKVTVVGKWFIAKHDLKLIRNGIQITETTRTDYTTDDFAQFYEDGSGYQSAKGNAVAPSLTTFNYTLKDSVITLYLDGNKGVIEKIISLTQTGFAIHSEAQIFDPVNPALVDTEIDDFTFKR